MQFALRDHVVIIEWPHLIVHRLVRNWWPLILVVSLGLVVAIIVSVVNRLSDHSTSPSATLQVSSAPPGAEILVDGHSRGHTPTLLTLAAGPHQISVRKTGYLDRVVPVTLREKQTTALDADLWLATPLVTPLRSVLPGMTLADARFLPDGRVVLTLALPDARRETWLLDESRMPHQVGPEDPRPGVAVAPDGARVAYLAASKISRSGGIGFEDALTELWVTRPGQKPAQEWYGFSSAGSDAALLGVSWAPDGSGLLLVVHQPAPNGGVDGASSRLLWVSANLPNHPSRELITLPAVILPGSIVWSPRGDQVAFLVRSDRGTASCLIHSDGSDFRYLSDLTPSPDAANLPAPVTWSADERRIAYRAAAPNTNPESWPFGAAPRSRIIVENATRPDPKPLTVDAGANPVWWGTDGTIATLVSSDRAEGLTLDTIAPDGQARVLGAIPLHSRGAVAVRWDLARAQAIIEAPASTSFDASLTGGLAPEFWLVRWRPEEVK